MYYLKAIILENCPYSINANKLIDIHKIPSKIINVNNENKHIYKTDIYDTFPQIYLEKNGKLGSLLLGGYNNLYDFIMTFKGTQYSTENVNEFMNKSNWSKKATLRLIQLIN